MYDKYFFLEKIDSYIQFKCNQFIDERRMTLYNDARRDGIQYEVRIKDLLDFFKTLGLDKQNIVLTEIAKLRTSTLRLTRSSLSNYVLIKYGLR